jgi:protein-disulfide isomerase
MVSNKSLNNENILNVVSQLLRQLKVTVSATTIQEKLEEHPEYPSLLAISDCLNDWNISTEAYQIPKADYDPNDLKFPFIAHLDAFEGSYMLVHQVQNQVVSYSDEQNSFASLSETDFLNKWSGITLFATATEKSGEANYRFKRVQETVDGVKVPLLIATLIIAVVLTFQQPISAYHHYLTLLINGLGLALSIMLLIHSLDANNPFIQNLCSLGHKNNCNAILRSKAAQVTPGLSWSEVGFFYFAGSFLTLIFLPTTTSLLAILNILALPFTIYSISYQYKNKNWCMICTGVQALLWIGFLVNISRANPFNYLILDLNTREVTGTIICFLLPVLGWLFFKPYLSKGVQYQLLKTQLQQFKFNSELFNKLLVGQPKFAVPDDLTSIVLGNPNAETTITMVSNPFCSPCAKAHETLHNWLEQRDDIKLKIIFTPTKHDDDEKNKVSKHVNALGLLKDSALVAVALNSWYQQSNKKYESWAQKYPVSFDEQLNIVTQKQKAWCKMAEITSTPTILVNGYKLPKQYQLDDIKYLLY